MFKYFLNNSFAVIAFITYIIGLVFSIGIYVLRAVGLYKMCKNTGIANPWLSFIPVANRYLVGKLADRYNQQNGKKSPYAVVLPILSLAPSVISIILFSSIVISTINPQHFFNQYWRFEGIEFLGVFFSFGLVSLIGIASAVLYIIALYFVYKDFEPTRVIPYTILSVFNFEFIPFILMRDNIPVGMAGECRPCQPKFQ